jgi:DNA-binding transcriptional LysR family regulator
MQSDWDDLRILLALARAGGLVAAARQLKVDPTTVSRRLTALEESLGARLVVRNPDGIRLTPEGELAVDAAERMEQALGAMRRQLECGEPSGVVRLTTTDAFAQFLLHSFADLAASHPALRVELLTGNVTFDLVRGDADLALRFARPTQEGVVARKIGTVGWALYGSDTYLAAGVRWRWATCAATTCSPSTIRSLPRRARCGCASTRAMPGWSCAATVRARSPRPRLLAWASPCSPASSPPATPRCGGSRLRCWPPRRSGPRCTRT